MADVVQPQLTFILQPCSSIADSDNSCSLVDRSCFAAFVMLPVHLNESNLSLVGVILDTVGKQYQELVYMIKQKSAEINFTPLKVVLSGGKTFVQKPNRSRHYYIRQNEKITLSGLQKGRVTETLTLKKV